MGNEKAEQFLDKLKDMTEFLIPNYILEGKNQLVISIGCTGGKHRSVTLANGCIKFWKNRKITGCVLNTAILRKIQLQKGSETMSFREKSEKNFLRTSVSETLPDRRTSCVYRHVRNSID